MKFAQWRGLQTIAWAQGIGPLNRNITQWIAQQTFRSCDGVSVRDRNSAALIDTWGITGPCAQDPVWALVAQPMDHLKALPHPRIAVSLREHPHLTHARLHTLGQALALSLIHIYYTPTYCCIATPSLT